MEPFDLARAVWKKSTRSSGNGNCASWAHLEDGSVAFRDTKLGDDSPVLIFTRAEWAAFLGGVKDGEADA